MFQLFNDANARDAVVPALRKSLQNLQLDYVDMYLIHFPNGVFVSSKLYTPPLFAGETYPAVNYQKLLRDTYWACVYFFYR